MESLLTFLHSFTGCQNAQRVNTKPHPQQDFVHHASCNIVEILAIIFMLACKTGLRGYGLLLSLAARQLVSFPDRLSSAWIAFSIKAIHAGVGWVWDRDY